MNPSPFFTNCRSCGAPIQMRPDGQWEDGRPRWQPFNAVIDVLGGVRVATDTNHYSTCPHASRHRRGLHSPPPAHEHQWRRASWFDVERGRLECERCPCGQQRNVRVAA